MSGLDVTRWALDKRVVAGAIFGLFAVSGLATYNRLPRSEDPGFIVRQAVIVTEFPGASAARVEELITDRLEAGLQKLVGLDFVNSVSRAGQSVITVAAQETLPEVESMWDEMRERVEEQARALPAEAIGPFINDDFGDVFGTLLALTGRWLQSRGARRRRGRGAQEDPAAARRRQGGAGRGRGRAASFSSTTKRGWRNSGSAPTRSRPQLQSQNIVSPSGRVNAPDRVFEVQTEGSYESLDALGATLIRVDDRAFPLKELVQHSTRVRRRSAGPFDVVHGAAGDRHRDFHGAGRQAHRAWDRGCGRWQRSSRKDLPVGLELHLASYQTAVVESAVGAFVGNLLQSVVIVLAVMLVALGAENGGHRWGDGAHDHPHHVRDLWDCSAIGINKMSLTALIIALGLLVDNGIVMSESILVRRNVGRERLVISRDRDGDRELRVPLLISSLTTVAALLPTYTRRIDNRRVHVADRRGGGDRAAGIVGPVADLRSSCAAFCSWGRRHLPADLLRTQPKR